MPPLVQKVSTGAPRDVTVTLDAITRRRLQRYCVYADVSQDEVVAAALGRLFEADVDFGPWQKANPEPIVAPKKISKPKLAAVVNG
jgi:hypothetical protein